MDVNIQRIAEKYLNQAVTENECADGGAIVVMRPSTGDILAIATSNNYDLNNPFVPNTDELKQNWDTMSSSEKNNALQKMWRNIAVADTYEPGSTFKVIPASIALEEGIVKTDTEGEFNCSGTAKLSNGVSIKCWKYPNSHGAQSLRKSLMNSCNPAFISLGQRIGTETFYKYLEAFGFFEKTGSGLVGDTAGIFFDKEDVGITELATISFGQRFQITPLQLANAACAIANGGYLMKPRIVKEIKDNDGNVIQTIEPECYRQVISNETSEEVLSMMTSVVSDGTGRYAQVSGYQVGGKTGTAEVGVGTDKYTASFLGIAPTTNPEIVVLVTLFDPKGEDGHGGGAIAAPVAGKVISEVLNHLEVQPDEEGNAENNNTSSVLIPELRNKTIAEAEKQLNDIGVKFELSGNEDKNTTLIIDQVPKPGVSIPNSGIVKLYTESNNTRNTVTVPDLRGLGKYSTKTELTNVKLNMKSSGSGIVIMQNPVAGSEVEEGTVVTVELKDSNTETD